MSILITFYVVYYRFLFCGYHKDYIYQPMCIPIYFKLNEHILKLHFYSFPYFVLDVTFYILLFCVSLSYCSYNYFYYFCILTFMLVLCLVHYLYYTFTFTSEIFYFHVFF